MVKSTEKDIQDQTKKPQEKSNNFIRTLKHSGTKSRKIL